MTLKDVAQKAGCSVATVSKALKNSSEISEQSKKRILEVAEKSGYLKKAVVHKAVLGGIKTVIFNDANADNYTLYTKVLPIARKNGYVLIYVTLNFQKAKELLKQIGAYGLIDVSRKNNENLFVEEERIFYLSETINDIYGAKDFFEYLNEYMPKRPSRAANGKASSANTKKASENQDENAGNSNKDISENTTRKKEEIWLL